MMNYGEKIRDIRKLHGITQQGLADKAGMSVMSIRRYEEGKRTPNIESLRKIAKALNCSAVELIPLNVEVIGAVEPLLNKEENAALQKILIDNVKDFGIKTSKVVSELTNTLAEAFTSLNAEGQRKALEYMRDLSNNPDYRRK